MGHEKTITSIAFSPDGRHIVTGSLDKTVRLWNFEQPTVSEEALLQTACNRLISHPILVKPKTEEAKAAGKTCQTKAWDPTQNAQFFIAQGRAIAQEGNVDEAVAKFKQARQLDPNQEIDPEAEARRLADLAQSKNEENPTLGEFTLPKIPDQATNGQVTLSEFTLNNKGNVASAAPGEQISVSANYIYDCPNCQAKSYNQIIVGIAGEDSAQACIYDALGIKGSGSKRFTLTSPKEPGTYYIRFRYAQAYGCEQGAKGWWRVDGEPTAEANIGVIFVGRPEH